MLTITSNNTVLSCRGPLPHTASTCTNYPTENCIHNTCTSCCIARGDWGTFGCQVLDHRTYINHSPYFRPNFTSPSPTPRKPYRLPVVSPSVGDFTRPAGFAYIECVGEGWEAAQLQMRDDARARFRAEGVTIYVFIWHEEATKPATYMRVVQQGNKWSLQGDTSLYIQLWNLPSYDFELYLESQSHWVHATYLTEIPITSIGQCIYIKSLRIAHVPHMPSLLHKMYPPVSFPFESTS